MSENDTNTLLTSDVYENIINTKKENMIELKITQKDIINGISNYIESLKNLRLELKTIRKNIRLTKRALRVEKRKLFKVNKSLEQESLLVQEINSDFIKSDSVQINMNKYLTKNLNKKR